MATFELVVERAHGDTWPVVATVRQSGELPVRREGGFGPLLEELQAVRDLESAVRERQMYGEVLGEAVFRGGVRDLFIKHLPEDGILRFNVVVEDPELRRLQWQRLCAPIDEEWRHLAVNQRTPFSVGLLSSANRQFRALGRGELRGLVAVACPPLGAKFDVFDAAAVAERARDQMGAVPSDVLCPTGERATFEALLDRLSRTPYAVLHLVAHGRAHSDGKGEAVVYLETPDGTADPVEGSRLVERLKNLRDLPQLVFLSVCHSADERVAGAAMAGLGQRLVEVIGIPAVVGMTDKVKIPTALAFADVFYRELFTEGVIDVAVATASAHLAERGDVTVPALFSRSADRPLFVGGLHRPLGRPEMVAGVTRLRTLVDERAPVLATALRRLETGLVPLAGGDPAGWSPDQRSEHELMMAEVDALSLEVAEVGFPALATGQPVANYDGRCPFLGLLPFSERDKAFFFGRDALVARLDAKLEVHRFLPVLGPSGSGKSSLVIAGLVPYRAGPGRRPHAQSIVVRLSADAVAGLATAREAVGASGLVVIDQFEELFTAVAADRRREIVDAVLADAETGFVVLTMRADFWGDCAGYAHLRDRMQATQELIGPLAGADLRRAIEQQADAVGLRLDPGLAVAVLRDVEDQPGAMPLLQHTLRQLWLRRHGRWLRLEEYERLGGAARAIAATADEVVDGLAPDDQRMARQVLVGLTTVGEEQTAEGNYRDTRRRASVEDLVPVEVDPVNVLSLIRRLADARLVVTSNDGEGRAYAEVAHEALIRYWPRLRGWLDEDRAELLLRDEVARSARRWDQAHRLPKYLDHRQRLDDLDRLAQGKRVRLNALEDEYRRACTNARTRELVSEREIARLGVPEAGWGVIFAEGADPAVRDALEPLLELRRQQATESHPGRFRVFAGPDGHRSGESAPGFLRRFGAGSGAPDPEKVPYYLLIVGPPTVIPWEFQYQLDVQYAVGRLDFDTADEYANYARTAVAAARGEIRLPRRMWMWGWSPEAEDRFDPADLLEGVLATPLLSELRQSVPHWEFDAQLGKQAAAEDLRTALDGSAGISLMLTLCHGMNEPIGHPDSRQVVGSFVTSYGDGGLEYFAAENVDVSQGPRGLVAFCFGEYSAGASAPWSLMNNDRDDQGVSGGPYSSRLAQTLLSHPRGGLVALIGHIDTNWFYSIGDTGLRHATGPPKLTTEGRLFLRVFQRLIDGYTVGTAMEPFNQRHAELAAQLVSLDEQDGEYGRVRTAMLDVRNYVVLGDPAVTLCAEPPV